VIGTHIHICSCSKEKITNRFADSHSTWWDYQQLIVSSSSSYFTLPQRSTVFGNPQIPDTDCCHRDFAPSR
jgi:hypothetical protein